MKRIRAFASALKRGLIWTLLAPPRSVRWIARKIWQGIRYMGRQIKRFVLACLRSPRATYNKAKSGRDWLLVKVEYLQSESAKWRTTFTIAKLPYTFLTKTMGLSPAQAASFLVAGSVATSGVVVNETILAEKSFSRGDSGTYAASLIGENAPLDIPTEYVEGDNTLRIDLGSTPVREIIIEHVSVGTAFTGSSLPSGETNVVQISGNPTAEGFTATRLEVGTLIFENSRCKSLTLSDINTHTLIVTGNASDGQSIAVSPGVSTTVNRMRAIGGGHHQAESMVTSGGTYDRIWIQSPSSGINAKIGTLRLTNLFTKGGACVLSAIDAGTVKILLNQVGEGNGFATKEFVIATSVTAAHTTITDNIELSISEPATQ